MKLLMLLLACVPWQDGQASSETWQKYQPLPAGAQFEMPAKPIHTVRHMEIVPNQEPTSLHTYMSVTRDPTTSYVFAFHDHAKREGRRHEIRRLLREAADGAKKYVVGEIVQQEEIMRGKNHGLAFTILASQNGIPIKIKQRIYMVDRRQFQLNVVAEEKDFDDVKAEKFFESFVPKRIPRDLPPQPLIDRIDR